MPLATDSIIVGTQAKFFRSGTAFTVPSAGTASATAKPGDADTAWITLGLIQDMGINPESDEKQVWGPDPGGLRLAKVISTKRRLSLKMTVGQMSPLIFELIFGTLALTGSSTTYTPLEGPTKEGWLNLKNYNHNDVLINTVDLYVLLKVDGEVRFDDNVVMPTLSAFVLKSALNSGTL